MGQIHMGRANPFRELVAGLTADEFLLLREAFDERCRRILSAGPKVTGMRRLERRLHRCRRHEIALPLLREEVHPPHGHRPRAPPQANPRLVSFIRLMSHNVPVERATELYCVTHKMAFGWAAPQLATASSYQDRIVQRDTVWIDETYINGTDLSKGYRQVRKRSLSRQKLCIGVAIDVHKNPVAVAYGHRRPSSPRVRKDRGSKMAPGSPLIHDLKRAHSALVRDDRLESGAHRANVNDPIYLERMEMVNDLCPWLKRYLWRFTGMSPRNPQAYLDRYACLFRVDQAYDR